MAEPMTPQDASSFMKKFGIPGTPLVCPDCQEVLDIMGDHLTEEHRSRILRDHYEGNSPYFNGCPGTKKAGYGN
jgi:hypothetical protein